MAAAIRSTRTRRIVYNQAMNSNYANPESERVLPSISATLTRAIRTLGGCVLALPLLMSCGASSRPETAETKQDQGNDVVGISRDEIIPMGDVATQDTAIVRITGKGDSRMALKKDKGKLERFWNLPLKGKEEVVPVPLDGPGAYVLKINAADAVAKILISGQVRATHSIKNGNGIDFKFMVKP